MLREHNENNLKTRDQYLWQLQSEQIARVLTRNGLQADGMTGKHDSRMFRFDVRSQFESSASKLRDIAREVILALGVNDINIRQMGSNLQLGVPQLPEVAVPLLDLMAYVPDLPKITAVLGLAEDNAPVLFNFGAAATPHLLIAGGPNAGKTSMLRATAISLAINNRQSDLQLAVICPSASDPERQRAQMAAWMPVNYLPHMLCDVTSRHTAIGELLIFFSQEIAYREKNSFQEPCIVVVIDEVDTVLSRGGRECAEALLLIAQKGAAAGIHLVLGARDVNSNLLSAQLLADLPFRLVGRSTPDRMKRIFPVEIGQDIQALLGEGDFVALQNGHARRLQGAFVSDYELHLSLSRMYQSRGILLAEPLDTRVRLAQPSTRSSYPDQNEVHEEALVLAV